MRLTSVRRRARHALWGRRVSRAARLSLVTVALTGGGWTCARGADLSLAAPLASGGSLRLVVSGIPQVVDRGVAVSSVRVEIRDATGALHGAPALVTARLSGPARFSSGTTATATVSGAADFAAISTDAAGAVTAEFSADGVASASVAFQVVAPPASPTALASYAITGVTLVPGDVDRALPNQTVLVGSGRVTAIGPSGAVVIPPRAIRIDGSGKWLAPGLTDFHTHERALPDWPDDAAGNFLMLLANGVTSIVNMGDFTGALPGLRTAVANGALPGPRVYAGQFVRGPGDGGVPVAADGPSARLISQKARAEGYDFLKVYDRVPLDAFETMVAESRAGGLAVIGHHMPAVGAQHAMRNGLSMFVHASQLANLLSASAGPGERDALAAELRTSGTAVTATLFVFEMITSFGLTTIGGQDPTSIALGQPGVEFMHDLSVQG